MVSSLFVCLVDPCKIFALYPFTSISHTSCPQQIMHSTDTQLKYKWDVSFCSFTQRLPKAPASRHGWRGAAVCACMMKENRITDQSDRFLFCFFFFLVQFWLWCVHCADTNGQIEKKQLVSTVIRQEQTRCSGGLDTGRWWHDRTGRYLPPSLVFTPGRGMKSIYQRCIIWWDNFAS